MIINYELNTEWFCIIGIDFKVYFNSLTDAGIENFNAILQKNKNLSFLDLKEKVTGSNFENINILIISGNSAFAKADIVASKPIFYGSINNTFYIKDTLFNFKEPALHYVQEYISSGYVYGNKTLDSDYRRLQAGEELFYDGKNIHFNRYFEYKYDFLDKRYTNENIFIKEFDRLLIEVINVLPKTQRLVIPLSGGHDSRLIVNYLFKLNYTNVICFSYGLQGNIQSKLSKQVADALHYKWHFVEYTEEKWKNLHDKGYIKNYLKFAFNGCCTPNLQDFLAVYELKEKGVIKEYDLIIPGHTFDFLSGGHLNDEDFNCKSKQDALERTLRRHFFNYNNCKVNLNNVKNHIGLIFDDSKVSPENFQEYFNWQERQSKYIVNSIRTYEFFNLNVFIPFWNSKLVKIWLKVPAHLKSGRGWYFQLESKLLMKKLKNIQFEDSGIPKTSSNVFKARQIFENLLKKLLPNFVIIILLRLSKRKLLLNEGMNQIYALQGVTLKDLIGPLVNLQTDISLLYRHNLLRHIYQLDSFFVTRLLVLRMFSKEPL